MTSKRRLRRAVETQARRRASWDWIELRVNPALLVQYPTVRNVLRVVRNDFWIVQVYAFRGELGEMVHLAIRSVKRTPCAVRFDAEPCWRELQRIKNEIVGPDREAVQVYPRSGELVDDADMYHLFVYPKECPIPFGLHRENGFEPTLKPTPEELTNEQS